MNHHFDALGLSQGASQQEIQEAYDRLSKELNPSNNDNQAFFSEEYKKVQKAYKVINKSSILKNNNSFSSSSPTKKIEDSSSSLKDSGSFTVTISPEKIEELKTKTLSHKNITPDGLKILCVLSMFGTGFFLLIIFTSISFSFNLGIFSFNLGISFFLLAIPLVLKFIGTLQMYKAKKNGYLIYMISSILLNLLFLFSLITVHQKEGDPLTALTFILTMIVFSIIFHSYKKYLS